MMNFQLSKVELALSRTTNGLERKNLLSLQADIHELITLTKESLDSSKSISFGKDDDNFSSDNDDPMAREYAIFKVIIICLLS